MESNDLTVFDPANLTIKDMTFVANEILASKMFPDLTTAHQAFVKILAGREMGITPFQAVAGMHIVQGKAVPGGGLLAAAVKGGGKYDYRVKKLDDTGCEIEFYQRNGDKWEPLGVSTFTAADAKKAGTKNTEKFPRNMYFNRAMSNGVKWYTPDATNGPVYVEGEIEPGPVTTSPESPHTDAVTEDFSVPTDEPPAPELEVYNTGLAQVIDDAFTPNPITDPQRKALFAILRAKQILPNGMKQVLVGYAKAQHNLVIESINDLSKEQASEIIDSLKDQDPQALEIFFT